MPGPTVLERPGCRGPLPRAGGRVGRAPLSERARHVPRQLTRAQAGPSVAAERRQETEQRVRQGAEGAARPQEASNIVPAPDRRGEQEPEGPAPAAPPSGNPLARFWAGYQRRVETDPVPTKAVTSFFGFVIGDVLAQRIEGDAFSALRTLRLGLYGLALDGPVGHAWYKLLDRFVEPQAPRSTKAVLLKTAADQLVWAPVMTCVFFAVLKSLEGHPELIMPTIQDKLLKTVVANYVIWPAAHFINFRFVPTEHRILYNNVVSVAWTAYLSTLSHVPIVDVDDLSSQLAAQQSQLFESLPPAVQSSVQSGMRAVQDSLLPRGQHFGLDLSIPKQIEIRSPRALPADVSLAALAQLFGWRQ